MPSRGGWAAPAAARERGPAPTSPRALCRGGWPCAGLVCPDAAGVRACGECLHSVRAWQCRCHPNGHFSSCPEARRRAPDRAPGEGGGRHHAELASGGERTASSWRGARGPAPGCLLRKPRRLGSTSAVAPSRRRSTRSCAITWRRCQHPLTQTHRRTAAATTAKAVTFMASEILSASRRAFCEGSSPTFPLKDRTNVMHLAAPTRPVASGAVVATATTSKEDAR